MKIEQIYDKGLAHGSYAIASEGKVALIDPGRDPQPYIDFAKRHDSKIVAVFETHPHADFASSHLEFQKRFGAKIYINPKVGVSYEYEPVEDGDEVKIGNVTFKTLFTPGHSPDHNTYLLLDEHGNQYAVFTGDALFVGDVGRPDLREGAGNINMKKEELAGQMYNTVQNIFKPLKDNVLVYPAHGGGSACGKSMSVDETYSTIGKEKERNWAMQAQEKADFVKSLLEDQVSVPKYFPYEVEMNRKGFKPLAESIKGIQRLSKVSELEGNTLVIDSRSKESFKKGHLNSAVNLPDDEKYERWLGAIVAPEEPFYILADNEAELKLVIMKSAKIGYEGFIKGAMVVEEKLPVQSKFADAEEVKEHPEKFTIVDVREESEVKAKKIFPGSINIPLAELRERTGEVPLGKPVAVHCAGGYRSAIGSSILEKAFGEQADVQDISEAIKEF